MTFRQIFRKPITQQYPEYKRPVYPRFRGRHRLNLHAERAREVRRLLALRGRLPGGLHPGRPGGEHRREPRLRGRALRAHLRDQPLALHLLRLLRARLPVRRDHARQRVRDLGVLARRPDLHEGHAPRRADQEDPGRGRGALRHAHPLLQDEQLRRRWATSSSGSSGSSLPLACLGSAVAVVSFQNPFYSALSLIGNLSSLAVLYLLSRRSSSPQRRCSSTRARSSSCSCS